MIDLASTVYPGDLMNARGPTLLSLVTCSEDRRSVWFASGMRPRSVVARSGLDRTASVADAVEFGLQIHELDLWLLPAALDAPLLVGVGGLAVFANVHAVREVLNTECRAKATAKSALAVGDPVSARGGGRGGGKELLIFSAILRGIIDDKVRNGLATGGGTVRGGGLLLDLGGGGVGSGDGGGGGGVGGGTGTGGGGLTASFVLLELALALEVAASSLELPVRLGVLLATLIAPLAEGDAARLGEESPDG